MSSIPIESAEDALKEELEYERQQKQVCADNFMQAMILYNKSEDERKQEHNNYISALKLVDSWQESAEKLEKELANAGKIIQANARHHNKKISELATLVLEGKR
jgi:hypothetical protein